MGLTDIFRITGYRGSFGDPKVVTESLLKIHEKGNRKNDNPQHIQWQDIVIPTPFECPEIEKVCDYIVNTTAEQVGYKIQGDDPWSICNGPLEQTYPHNHTGCGCKWACVYWAQVPVDSGMLSIYPLGFDGPEVLEKPTAGDFFIFPSFLIHGVRHNASSEKRVSMSFNMRPEES